VLPDDLRANGAKQCDQALEDDRFLVLYFPGNAANRSYRGMEVGALTELGANVFLFDYRGYGDNEGSPTEEALAADARVVWNYATNQREVAPERVVLYGESLGGGVAIRLAAELCREGIVPGGVVLRSTFSSLVDAAAYHYPWLPVRWLLVDRFESTTQMPDVCCPVLQVHGTKDRIVPLRLGRRLYEAVPASSPNGAVSRFVELRGAGHNDVMYVADIELQRAVQEFLEDLDASRGKR
jgi:fermentation-respiration switch protein FrsA (DUF1100 family)